MPESMADDGNPKPLTTSNEQQPRADKTPPLFDLGGTFERPKAQTIAGFDLSSIYGAPEEHHKARKQLTDGANSCHFHPDVAPEHICRMCSGLFCRECIKTVGSSKVTLCPLCGDLCNPFHEILQKEETFRVRSAGFGFQDLRDSIVYPFKHLIALLFGAFIYGLFQIGGLRTQVIAFAVLFGCIAHAINHVAVGRFSRSFLPDFSAFDILEDFVRPIFLGIGIVIVTLGPVIALTLFIVWNVLRAPAALEPPPQAQSKMLTSKDFDELVNSRDEKKSEELSKKIVALDPRTQIVEQVKKTDEETSAYAIALKFLHIPMWCVLLLFLSIIWAVFYYPMALTVAGYSENFKATINPLTGIDTMKRMGGTYAKAFLMYLLIQCVGIGVLGIIGIVTAPLNIPLMGNLPANFLGGIVTFYFSLVTACLMGLALFKCADKLGIATD